ncbi:chitin deacetylase 7-like isoform X3 [Daphnia pulicaria]|uniref:chitin deacetylase 7-like isoform X3 n=1 Tax=Daphnia pulicaria TaxID=35523 RepID=UPI001EEC6638|nr:chitin deacetylase 7-like isoform X3 [Daphnia pulicaria]
MLHLTKYLTILLVISEFTPSLTAEPLRNQTVCESTKCVLPDCLCMSTSPPMGLNPKEIPQIVFLTFDDALNYWMYPTYQKILGNRTNPNGCNIGMTFFVSHESGTGNTTSQNGTDYRLVNEFFNRGHEIASHSVTHKADFIYWKNTSVDFWEREAGRQRKIINTYANIPFDKIQGFRAPYLQTGGDATFIALNNLGMNFDSSLPSITFSDPPIWPYTLDHGITQDCVISPCITGKFPGLWEIPLLVFQNGNNGSICSMPDFFCFPPDSNLTTAQIFDYFMFNFQRFNKTRAPFGIFQHVYWFLDSQAVLEGFLKFLDHLATLDYVYIVPVSKGIEWMRNPMTLEQMKVNNPFSCDPSSIEQAPCPEPQVCYYNESVPGGQRSMGSCVPCPVEYPWLEDQSVSTTPVSTTPFSQSAAALKQPEVIAVISSILTIFGWWIL